MPTPTQDDRNDWKAGAVFAILAILAIGVILLIFFRGFGLRGTLNPLQPEPPVMVRPLPQPTTAAPAKQIPETVPSE